ncbi:MAG: hypothetical protein J6W17_01715, partial [Campylobacter sp.]|nr:hypothetical protein [Campylobacter sp.]
MNTPNDFELDTQEIAELKALLEIKPSCVSFDNGASFDIRRSLVNISDPEKFNQGLSKIKD